jgi:starch synthase (maltosyl-transferring)
MTDYQRERIVIENIGPCIDCGRFPIKRVTGQHVVVTADVFADGHEELSVVLRHRVKDRRQWHNTAMHHIGNDRWQASFSVDELGEYLYTVSAWVDDFRTWQKKLVKRVEANQDIAVDLLIGVDLLEHAASRVDENDSVALREFAARIRNAGTQAEAAAFATDARARELARLCPEHTHATTFAPALRVVVDRERAGFSAWYEMFPRSCSPVLGRHGTFKDCEARLPYVAALGFDVLYLPPIHPIGFTARKGRNNSVASEEGDPGTPWAIGSAAGGHKAVHPELGTLDDFRSLVAKAREHGMEVALDIAFQCSPDHPYVREHPGWFRWRPDGTVQYAENPPKKYQDIYPLEFDSDGSNALWDELHSIVQHWIDQGVRIFRVDNPHTKPFAFWEWLITSLRQEYPDLVFLAEAFTRPKVMARLAKLGFTQSYTYFTWRRSKWELIEYITELTKTELSEYFRPNFWPNTPDILMDYLQEGGRPAFEARFVLAATLSSNYGIYGPAFELCINVPREPGSEEYLNSEKYELKKWDLDAPESINALITRVNGIRRESHALQQTNHVRVEHVDDDALIAYSKWDAETAEWLLVVVSLDAKRARSGWLTVDLGHVGREETATYEVTDLLTGARFNWTGTRNFVSLGPSSQMSHVFRVGLPPPSVELYSNT